MTKILTEQILRDLKAEEAASRKCLERIPAELFSWKPHEKSMIMGYLALLVADIPKWITATIQLGEINFETWERFEPTTTEGLLERFDQNMKDAKEVLSKTTDEDLLEMFYLRSGEQELLKDIKRENISSSLRHWVHHRGQLTVYMRLNEIPVPSIYGPSADDKTF